MEMRDLRTAFGIDLETAASQIGIGKASLSRVERQLQIPSYAIVLKISEWAENQRRLRRLPAKYRPSWSWATDLQELRKSKRSKPRRSKPSAA